MMTRTAAALQLVFGVGATTAFHSGAWVAHYVRQSTTCSTAGGCLRMSDMDEFSRALEAQQAIQDKFKAAVTQTKVETTGNEKVVTKTLPAPDAKGIHLIKSREQHAAFLKANPDKLVVMKFTASYCRACAALNPKFNAIVKDKEFADLPIVWAEMVSSQKNKAFFRRLGVLSLPTVHFYDGSNGLVENFPCGPTNIPILVQKLNSFIAHRLDPATRQWREILQNQSSQLAAPRTVRQLVGGELITDEHLEYLHDGMPFFQDLTDEEFDALLATAQLEEFLPGDLVIRQGMPPTKFFVVKSGTLEMCIRSRFNDPISTPPSYLGAVVNQMGKFDYFGERALTTGEPYAASVRALEKSRCFAFDADEIPESSILSKKRRATRAMVDHLSQRYQLPEDFTPTYFTTEKDESILELLVRFKQIRQVAKCFEYVMSAEPLLGDIGEIARRSILASKLSKSQRQDFVEVFQMIDVNKKGTISLLDMRRLMESARKESSDEELLEVLEKANPLVEGLKYGAGITLDEFMGVMAEAEFYSLFTETFEALDEDKTGYVRAGDLDEVLGGVRDLISDDRKSIIDVEDQDVQVDYEQFARMLLGATL